MVEAGQRRDKRRLYLWVIGGLVAALGLFAVYKLWFRPHFISAAERMARLEKAPLHEPKTAPGVVGDWPQWRGPNRDGVSRETGWATAWPAQGPPVLWKKSAPGHSNVAVVGRRLYTMLRDGSDEVVVCLNADTGKQIWRYDYPMRDGETGRKFITDWGGGPRATPTVDGDRVYTVGATGILHCLKADTGKRVWSHDLLKEFDAKNIQWGVSFSPLVDGGLVFTSPGESDGYGLAAFDKRTGKLKWHNLDDKAGYSSPMAMTVDGIRQVLFFTARGLVGVAPDTGELFWRFDWETEYDCNIATPLVVDNYVFISSNYDRGCAVLEVTRDGGKLRADRVYEGNRMCNHYSTCVRWQDHLYGFHDSKLCCMNFRTGEIVWKQPGFKKGALLIADGHLIVLGENGKLAVAKATPEGFKARSSFQVTRTKCWTMPVLAHGKLYVRDEERLICLDVRKR
jgi:outer membrane protein assembly factor BamB